MESTEEQIWRSIIENVHQLIGHCLIPLDPWVYLFKDVLDHAICLFASKLYYNLHKFRDRIMEYKYLFLNNDKLKRKVVTLTKHFKMYDLTIKNTICKFMNSATIKREFLTQQEKLKQ